MLIDWNLAPTAPALRPGARRRVVTTDRTTVVRVDTAADAPFDGVAHRHEQEQWVLLLAGSLHFRCAGTEARLRPGDLVHVPPRQWHAVTAVGADGARYLEISTPPRLDLLPGVLLASPLEFRTPAEPASPSPDGEGRPALTTPEDSHAR